MSVSAKSLFGAKYAATTSTVEYTAPSKTNTIIDKFTATNTHSGAVTLSVYIVPAGETESAAHLVVKAKSIATGITSDCTELQNQILDAGDTIKVLSDTASKLVIRASGREVN